MSFFWGQAKEGWKATNLMPTGKTLAVSLLIIKEWGQVTGVELNPPSPCQIHPQPDGILRLAPLANLALKLPEQTRGQLCSSAPLTPCAHIHQWGMALHLNSDFCWNSCFGHKPMELSPVWILQGSIPAHPDARVTAVQSQCQVATMASYQPLIDSLNSSAWSLLLHSSSSPWWLTS